MFLKSYQLNNLQQFTIKITERMAETVALLFYIPLSTKPHIAFDYEV